MDPFATDAALLERGPLAAYRERRAAGALAVDAGQERAAERLQALWERLRDYELPPPAEGAGLWARLTRRRTARTAGLYLVGEVGRGKSMLMDLFFAAARVRHKRRIHFHEFMQGVHAKIHAMKAAQPDLADPIPPLAESIAAEAALLCFDEFQVNDIADAMILGRLFEALFARFVVIVATSNTRPADLFRDQPGRDAFLPFIALITRHLDVLEMDAGPDYRRGRQLAGPHWLVPDDGRARRTLDAAFAELSGGVAPHAEVLTVMGRALRVPQAGGGVARFDFATLCRAALGAGDYLALARRYHTLVLQGVPRLGEENVDEARRFVVLIDTLYDHHVQLLASAETGPDHIYRRGPGAQMFERTASRLEEMQSRDYLVLPHLT